MSFSSFLIHSFITALDDGGATVLVPTGVYRFSGSIVIGAGVTMQGSFSVVPSHSVSGLHDRTDGTVLVPIGGRGNEDGPPFMSISNNGVVRGVVVYYAEQETVMNPVAYPWTIQLSGNNAAVMDVELLGAWNGINATGAARHYIARVQGQPINIGIYVDSTYDIGRF